MDTAMKAPRLPSAVANFPGALNNQVQTLEVIVKKLALTPILAGTFLLSPLAMAGEMDASDSKFLFDEGQASAKTLSHEEMKSTDGKLAIGLVVDASAELAAIGAVLDKVLALLPPIQIGDID